MEKQPKFLYTGKLGKFMIGGKVISSHDLEKTFSSEALERAVKKGILKKNKRYEEKEIKKEKEKTNQSFNLEGKEDVKEESK